MIHLYRIVYLSRATGKLGSRALADMAEEARGRNAAVDVTGLLIYDGERFIQALEGPSEAVQSTMERIERDARHDSISYLGHGPLDRRQFGDWSMKVKRAPEANSSTTFVDRVKAAVDAVQDPRLRAAFIGFSVLSARRARTCGCGGSDGPAPPVAPPRS